MPPDAAPIAAFGALLERFYDKAGLHGIWEKHRPNYAALVERYHVPLTKMVFDTDIYLKLQSGGYLGRTFTIYLDFLGDPNQANARTMAPITTSSCSFARSGVEDSAEDAGDSACVSALPAGSAGGEAFQLHQAH